MIVRNKKILVSASLFLLGAVSAFAQQQGPPQPRMSTMSTPPPGLPIDSSIIFLFALALVYGIYITFRLSKKESKL